MTQEITTQPTGEIIVTLESEELHFDYAQYGVTYESTPKEIVDAISPAVSEASPGFDLVEEFDNGSFTMKKVDSSHNAYLFFKSTLG